MDKDRLGDYRLKADGAFEISNYRSKPLFFSFLPGIAGAHGRPVWAFYTNRGQCVCSFGVENKQHSIMEYFPANQAAARVELQGFRTFLRVDGTFYEPFAAGAADRVSLRIHLNQLELCSRNEMLGIEVKVAYFAAPECPQAALVRRVSIANLSGQTRHIEVADGMPCVIPCGISHLQFKTEGNTFMAWADTQRLPAGEAFYGVQQSLTDGAEVTRPEDGYFCAARVNGMACPVIVDPMLLFEADASLQMPVGFVRNGADILREAQYTVNRTPCAFAAAEKDLVSGQRMNIDSLFGYADNVGLVHGAAAAMLDNLDGMQAKANGLIAAMLDDVKTRTASPELDAYIGQCYLDNILRGGRPVAFAHRNGQLLHYIYGRRHGDLERDYNEFQLNAAYYSQGNGSYRDLCQNRRSDVFFTPDAGLLNIRTFMELIQIDGYNPLSINGYTYRVAPGCIAELGGYLRGGHLPAALMAMLENGFDVGELLHYAEAIGEELTISPEDFTGRCMYEAEQRVAAAFKAGYWSDHFSYNIDLIESWLAMFPEKLDALLYEEKFRFHRSGMRVQPCSRQYAATPNGIRRYNAVIPVADVKDAEYLADRAGHAIEVPLYVKLLSLALNKFCCLDPGGMGIDMEAGKPGWNDSLNGLPGMLGSGIPETIELLRIVRFLIAAPSRAVKLPCEIDALAAEVDAAARQTVDSMERWRRLSMVREEFRSRCCDALSGDERLVQPEELRPLLIRLQGVLQAGIDKAQEQYGPLIPTYLAYTVTEYREGDGRIEPLAFQIQRLPDYLEAPARLMGSLDAGQAAALHEKVKSSALWDAELRMFKVCDSLEALTHEVGRTRAFPRGWFENESVFLHMSYKYLLGLLKAGLYEAFFAELKTSFVPFFNAERYGRSILENCSFIASSVNPDPKTHGRGYIARLSGATAEALSMWLLMTTGGVPFAVEQGELRFQLQPKLAGWLFDECGEVRFTMLGQTEFCIVNREQLNTYEMGIDVRSYEIVWRDGTTYTGETIRGANAARIRNQEAGRVIAYIGKQK